MIIFFYGKDSFRSYERVLEIKNKFLANDKSGSDLSSFDAEEEQNISSKFKSNAQSSGLFSLKKLLILKRVISGSPTEEQTKILAYLKENLERLSQDNDLVIIFWENDSPRKNNALFKFLFASAKKQDFEKLSGPRLELWIKNKIRTLSPDKTISVSALQKLIFNMGDDSAQLSQEINKLINFSDEPLIDDAAVELMVKNNSASNIFSTIEALAANKKPLALALLQKHFAQGDDAFYLLSMFIFQFRNLLRISAAQETGAFNEHELAKQTGLHPFVIKKGFYPAKFFGLKKLESLYAKLARIDREAKIGKVDLKLALDKFIVEL